MMGNIERCWLALSPGEPATTNIVGDEADLADYRAQNWIIQGPFVLEADLRGAVDALRKLERDGRRALAQWRDPHGEDLYHQSAFESALNEAHDAIGGQ